MTPPFPWTKQITEQLLKGFQGNTSFSVLWPWAPFHEPGFRALKWAAEKQMSVPQVYEVLSDLSLPCAPRAVQSRLRKAKLIDHIDRILPLDPAITIKKTFMLAGENLEAFYQDDIVLLTVDDLLRKNPEIETLWRPIYTEGHTLISRWLLRDQSLLKSFHEASCWNQLKIIEALVGVTKSSSLLNFERIY